MNTLKTSVDESDPLSVLQRCSVSVSSSAAPLSDPSPSAPPRRRATTSHPHSAVPSHHPLLPLPLPPPPIPHRHLSLDHQQVTLEDQSSATLRASAISRPRRSPIAFLPQASSSNPTPSRHSSQSSTRPDPRRDHKEYAEDVNTTPTFPPSSSSWSLNAPPPNFGSSADLVRHTTKLLKSRDSRTGRLIINQYMKGKEIGRVSWP